MNDYQRSAARYAWRGIVGTDAVVFHALAARLSALRATGRALDLGCGAGRSTRFLKDLGLNAVGVDVSEAMVAQARRQDPRGEYVTYAANGPLPFASDSFAVLLATWVVLEIGSSRSLNHLMAEAGRVLAVDGRGFIVTNTAAFYSHQWVSCEVDFPENQGPLRSGQAVKARLMPEGVVVNDTFWTDDDYRRAFAAGGLRVADATYPTADAVPGAWRDETRVAPCVIYELQR